MVDGILIHLLARVPDPRWYVQPHSGKRDVKAFEAVLALGRVLSLPARLQELEPLSMSVEVRHFQPFQELASAVYCLGHWLMLLYSHD